MRTLRQHGWLLLPVLAVLAVVASCGDGGGVDSASRRPGPRDATSTSAVTPETSATSDPSAAPSTAPTATAAAPTTVAAPPPPTPAPQNTAEAARARVAVLQLADLPAGYEAKPEDDQLEHETTWRDLTRCLGVEDTGQGLGSAVSPTFALGFTRQVTSAVEYLPAARTPTIAAAVVEGADRARCAEEALAADVRRNAPQGVPVDPVKVTALAPPGPGRSSAWRATTTVYVAIAQPVAQDFVIVFKGDAVIRTSFLGAGQPFPEDLRRTLVEKVVERA